MIISRTARPTLTALEVHHGDTIVFTRRDGTAQSFYAPLEQAGVRIWLDAVDAVFAFMRETHAPCRLQANCSHALPPWRQVRLAMQDAALRICPESLAAWCPLPEGGLRMDLCYRGEDCWMGAYDGASAHGGLDVNHPAGTPLYAPIALDDQFLYNSTAAGWNNNRWRGLRRAQPLRLRRVRSRRAHSARPVDPVRPDVSRCRDGRSGDSVRDAEGDDSGP